MRALNLLLTPRAASAAMMALIVLGIAANALLIQVGPHPAPFFQTRALQPATSAGADRPSDLKTGTTDHAAGEVERTRRIQRALKRLGIYDGPLDGVAGPSTHAAILAFWADGGASGPVGDLSLVEAELQRAVALLPPMPDPRPDPEILAVQEALARAAYGPLATDGMLGPETAAAVRRFQTDHDLAVTGEIDAALVARLIATGAMETP